MNYIKKIEAEFDQKFVSPKTLWAQDENGRWYGKNDVQNFIRTALTDFVKLAQNEIDVLRKKGNPEFETNQDFGYNQAIKVSQSTLSRLLSGEVEK